MRQKGTSKLLLAAMFLSASCAIAAEGDLTWYRFNKRFIAAHYTGDAAFGKVSTQSWAAAQSVHARSCGGKDGELHIGVREGGISWDSQNQVSSGKGSAFDLTGASSPSFPTPHKARDPLV